MARSVPNPSPRAIDGPALPASRGPRNRPRGGRPRQSAPAVWRGASAFMYQQVHLCTHSCPYLFMVLRAASAGRAGGTGCGESGAKALRAPQHHHQPTDHQTPPPLPVAAPGAVGQGDGDVAQLLPDVADLRARVRFGVCARRGGGMCVCARARVLPQPPPSHPRTLSSSHSRSLPRSLAPFLAPSLAPSLPRFLDSSLARSFPPSLSRARRFRTAAALGPRGLIPSKTWTN